MFKGLTDELLEWQTRELLAREQERRGIAVLVRPELVVEIAIDGVQASTRYRGGVALRFARVKRYRPDKDAAERGHDRRPPRAAPRAMSGWLRADELRVGLGCMRLDERGPETITAALEAGITVFDTARAYVGNEELLAASLRGRAARVVTKGGMGERLDPGRARADDPRGLRGQPRGARRPFDRPVPAPRARPPHALGDLCTRTGASRRRRPRRADRRREREPRRSSTRRSSWRRSRPCRRRSGRWTTALSGAGSWSAARSWDLTLLAHSPLGGPKRAGRLLRLASGEEALAWTLALSAAVVVLPGARRPETARSAARAGTVVLEPAERERLDQAFGRSRRLRGARPPADGDLVLVVGIPGAGKSRLAEAYTGRGYVRLNRDERGGTMPQLADALDELLAGGERHVVLDNTYLTRASRSHPVDAAVRHGLAPRCLWLDTPVAQAQANVVERLLDHFGELPEPGELRRLARTTPGVLAPTSQLRAVRELEPPSLEEGFVQVERVAFERAPRGGAAGVFIAASAVGLPGWDETATDVPHLVFDWGDGTRLAEKAALVEARVSAPVETLLCPHGGGTPVCWCRPPLPGLPLVFGRRHGVEPARSTLVGASRAHGTLAATLGSRYVELSPR